VKTYINLNEVCQQMSRNWHPMDGASVCGGSLFKINLFYKSPHSNVNFFNFMWYHWLNGNKVHVLKAIKSILIGAHVEIPNVCTFENE